VKSFSSAKDLPGNLREHVRQLLLAIADTKLLLGFHYAEWTFGTPALEACIAACSMSQDEFGHVRLLHACLNTQFGMNPNELIETRPAGEFATVVALNHPLKTWAETVAVNLLVDGAVTVVLNALRGSTFEPVANFMDKMVEEEKHHVRHGQGWFRTLASRNPETKAALQSASQRALAATLEWLGPDDHAMAAELSNAGVLNSRWATLRQHYLDWIGGVVEDTSMALGIAKKGAAYQLSGAVDYNHWQPQTRSSARAVRAVDEQILYHLRGSKNAEFKLGEAA
jgi:ring-1,2-phenylacetyl-CoA epoxidase subunit PaaC